MRGISWLAYDILASQEGLCSMELVAGYICASPCDLTACVGQVRPVPYFLSLTVSLLHQRDQLLMTLRKYTTDVFFAVGHVVSRGMKKPYKHKKLPRPKL
jgi:hypothetical protein